MATTVETFRQFGTQPMPRHIASVGLCQETPVCSVRCVGIASQRIISLTGFSQKSFMVGMMVLYLLSAGKGMGVMVALSAPSLTLLFPIVSFAHLQFVSMRHAVLP